MNSSPRRSASDSEPSSRHFQRSPRALREALNAASQAMLVVAGDGSITFANAAACRLWDYNAGALEGRPVSDLFPAKFEFLQLAGCEPERGAPILAEGLRGDGSTFGLRLEIGSFEIDGATHRILTVSEGEPEALPDREDLEEEVYRVLEQFASGLAHEYNNVLTGVLGNIHLAMRESEARGRWQPALLEGAYHASLRARTVTRQLLEFARGDEIEPCAFDLCSLVRENALLALGGSRVNCEFRFADDLHSAYADPTQLGQVIHQLIGFAGEAMGHRGTIRIRVENNLVTADDLGDQDEWVAAEYASISIEVNSMAFAMTDVSQLFEPYARSGGRNWGLSLSVARCIVQRHAGRLWAEISEDTRLVIRMLLPTTGERPVEMMPSVRKSQAPESSRSARILIMDDEALVRTVLERTLEAMGHRCVCVSDGRQAADEYRRAMERGERFDLTFLDMMVPGGTDGLEACEEIVGFDPLASVIVVSGNCSDDAMQNFHRYGFVGQLEKPFDMDTLTDLVEEILALEREEGAALDGPDAGSLFGDLSDGEFPDFPGLSNVVRVDFRTS